MGPIAAAVMVMGLKVAAAPKAGQALVPVVVGAQPVGWVLLEAPEDQAVDSDPVAAPARMTQSRSPSVLEVVARLARAGSVRAAAQVARAAAWVLAEGSS